MLSSYSASASLGDFSRDLASVSWSLFHRAMVDDRAWVSRPIFLCNSKIMGSNAASQAQHIYELTILQAS